MRQEVTAIGPTPVCPTFDGGTRVDAIWTWKPKGLVRAAAPLLDLMFRRAMEKDEDGLRRLMEASDL